MANIIAILNFKGGVGKTTTAINISAALARQKKNVLFIDLDGQCNSTFLLSQPNAEGELPIYDRTIYDCLMNQELDLDLDVYNFREHFDFVPASMELDEADHVMPGLLYKDSRLKLLLDRLADKYDYIIIDCPPHNGDLCANALIAANDVIVPVTGDGFSLTGLIKIMAKIKTVKKLANHNLELMGLLFTMYDKRTSICKNAFRVLEKNFNDMLFSQKIRICTKFRDLPENHTTIFELDPKGNGAFDYDKAVGEILNYYN